MECTTVKSNIESTASKVREASYNEKHNFTEQEIIDQFLDKLLDFKQLLKNKVKSIEEVTIKIEELTWYDISILDEEYKKKLNDVISLTKDWTGSLYRNYDRCLDVLKNRIEVEELSELKNAIDDLVEATADLENVVFFYPHDEQFQSITKELKDL